MNNHEFLAADIQAEIKTIFPKSYVNLRYNNRFGEAISGIFTIGIDGSEYANGIIQNDPLFTTFHLFVKPSGYDLEWGSGNLTIKPQSKYLAYSHVKTGMRNKKGTAEQVKKAVVGYFAKLPNIIKENSNLIHEQHYPLFQSKNLVP